MPDRTSAAGPDRTSGGRTFAGGECSPRHAGHRDITKAITGCGFGPETRLHTKREFEDARQTGRAARGRLLVVYETTRGDSGTPRLGLSVSRAVGCAVRRNRVKRIIRDAFRNGRHRLPAGTDVLVIARVAAASASHCDISRELFELDKRLRTG